MPPSRRGKGGSQLVQAVPSPRRRGEKGERFKRIGMGSWLYLCRAASNLGWAPSTGKANNRRGPGLRGHFQSYLLIVAALWPFVTSNAWAKDVPRAPRFFFSGNGHLKLGHAHFNTTLDVQYRRSDGSYDPAALQQIRHFFRSRGDDREHAMSLRLIELLSYVQQHYRPKKMVLLSGYRSPEFNAELGAAGQAVAMASLHTQGLASDIAFSGVDLRRLWLSLRELKTGGAGYYRKQNFLHIDTGPPRFWEETTSRVGENLSAGNARMFVRTDFDRYEDLQGAVLSLQSVTTLPLRLASRAHVIDRRGGQMLELAPHGNIASDGQCLTITTPAEAYELDVRSVASDKNLPGDPEAERPYIIVDTCEPRLERTPPQVRSNEIEVRR